MWRSRSRDGGGEGVWGGRRDLRTRVMVIPARPTFFWAPHYTHISRVV